MGEDSPHSLLSVKAMTHYITSLLGRSLTMVLYDTTMFNLIKIDIIFKRFIGFFGDMNVATLHRKYIAHVGKLCLTSSFMQSVIFFFRLRKVLTD